MLCKGFQAKTSITKVFVAAANDTSYLGGPKTAVWYTVLQVSFCLVYAFPLCYSYCLETKAFMVISLKFFIHQLAKISRLSLFSIPVRKLSNIGNVVHSILFLPHNQYYIYKNLNPMWRCYMFE